LPIIVEGQVIGGIGVGSGHGDQDYEVANAALGKFAGAVTF
jgi:glc operon protein GlcG